MNSGEDTTQQSAGKCESMKAPDPPALNNCGDQKQAININEKIENCDKTPNNEGSQKGEDHLVKSAISEQQLMFNFSMLNKKDSFVKIKPPVPRNIPSPVSTSLESEVSSTDATTFKVCIIKYCKSR